MDFVKYVESVKYTDYGNAQEISADKIGRLDFPSPGIIRVSLVTWHPNEEGDEYRLAVALRGSRHVWESLSELWNKYKDADRVLRMSREPLARGIH